MNHVRKIWKKFRYFIFDTNENNTLVVKSENGEQKLTWSSARDTQINN